MVSKLLVTSVKKMEEQNMYFSSSVVSITCMTGFHFEQMWNTADLIVECNWDGKWNLTIPACVPDTEVILEELTHSQLI